MLRTGRFRESMEGYEWQTTSKRPCRSETTESESLSPPSSQVLGTPLTHSWYKHDLPMLNQAP